MLIDKLKQITLEDIPSKNPSLKRYFALSTNEKNATSAYNTSDVAGQLIATQLNKQLKTSFTAELFISEVIHHFEKKISEEEYTKVIKDIYFSNEEVPVLSQLMYMAKPIKDIDTKTKKSLAVFKQMLQKNETKLELMKVDLNFIEEEIYNIFNTFIEDKQHNLPNGSYVNFLDEAFTKDFLFLLNNQHYFKAQIDRFLKFYLFTYSAQLALNIHSAPLTQPETQKLFFILNHEKASSERKNLVNYGYRTLIDKTRYMFPYLSLLENLSDTTEIDNLKFYHLNELQNTSENILIIDNLTKLYRQAKSLPETILESSSVDEAFQTLLSSTMEQFRTSEKKAVLDRFINAFEKQISGPFSQSRGRSGKVLVLDQDTILLLTNLAIGDKGQLRFQDLMDEFKERSVYFDPKSEDALLELYERVGNVDRKSDSGDAVYVKSI